MARCPERPVAESAHLGGRASRRSVGLKRRQRHSCCPYQCRPNRHGGSRHEQVLRIHGGFRLVAGSGCCSAPSSSILAWAGWVSSVEVEKDPVCGMKVAADTPLRIEPTAGPAERELTIELVFPVIPPAATASMPLVSAPTTARRTASSPPRRTHPAAPRVPEFPAPEYPTRGATRARVLPACAVPWSERPGAHCLPSQIYCAANPRGRTSPTGSPARLPVTLESRHSGVRGRLLYEIEDCVLQDEISVVEPGISARARRHRRVEQV